LVHSEQLSTDVIRTYHHIEMNEPL
jgi:hypothetical protein